MNKWLICGGIVTCSMIVSGCRLDQTPDYDFEEAYSIWVEQNIGVIASNISERKEETTREQSNFSIEGENSVIATSLDLALDAEYSKPTSSMKGKMNIDFKLDDPSNSSPVWIQSDIEMHTIGKSLYAHPRSIDWSIATGQNIKEFVERVGKEIKGKRFSFEGGSLIDEERDSMSVLMEKAFREKVKETMIKTPILRPESKKIIDGRTVYSVSIDKQGMRMFMMTIVGEGGLLSLLSEEEEITQEEIYEIADRISGEGYMEILGQEEIHVGFERIVLDEDGGLWLGGSMGKGRGVWELYQSITSQSYIISWEGEYDWLKGAGLRIELSSSYDGNTIFTLGGVIRGGKDGQGYDYEGTVEFIPSIIGETNEPLQVNIIGKTRYEVTDPFSVSVPEGAIDFQSFFATILLEQQLEEK